MVVLKPNNRVVAHSSSKALAALPRFGRRPGRPCTALVSSRSLVASTHILILTVAISKRGLDLGLSRGFSGSQAAKHLMGLAAANYAGGPGRRRRNVDESS
uniref:Diuretic hormone class 2 n=1 Tax=Timema monikensis TaxID=170555 RepID=A0A7R9E453_9NEOP|nr:unnamed protein product [Timema monikensis]